MYRVYCYCGGLDFRYGYIHDHKWTRKYVCDRDTVSVEGSNDIKNAMEHKDLMLERIEFLSRKMDNLEDVFEEYKRIREISEITHHLAVKYQLTADRKLLNKLIENVEFIKKRDGELLQKLYDRLCFFSYNF